MNKARNFWGWGNIEDISNPNEVDLLRSLVTNTFSVEGSLMPYPNIDDIVLPENSLKIPNALESISTDSKYERALHTRGRSFIDVTRSLSGDFASAPDFVIYPENENDILFAMDWCAERNCALVPFGGGSSVVGGLELKLGERERFEGVVSLDLGKMNSMLELDKTSRTGQFQGGMLGPKIEDDLRRNGLTLRHFPQSFEFSSLGGWIATRAGGHFATGITHIDDLVESIQVVSPIGIYETRSLPASGAGPDPNRLFMGSEGSLGVITSAWMRLQDRPIYKVSYSALFDSFKSGVDAARELVQSGLAPSNCRLLDPLEAFINGAGNGAKAVLIVGFESGDHSVEHLERRSIEIVKQNGGEISGKKEGETWKSSFIRAPYIRDTLIRLGVIAETFETAVKWNKFDEFHNAIIDNVTKGIEKVAEGKGLVTCRLTHLYPDGSAPYFTVLAKARPGSEISQWMEIKELASQTILDNGGTITHHHAVGRDHQKWYKSEIPEHIYKGFEALKHHFDPHGILNPGAVINL